MLITIFCEIDDFCKQFEKNLKYKLLANGTGKRDRKSNLRASEVMTICVFYHESGYKTFKDYYEKHVLISMSNDFHNLVSYNRFIELKQKAAFPLMLFFAHSNVVKNCTGISFIDSFSLEVCHIRRTYSHKIFKHIAKKGKTSVGWFYGFKLHVVINHRGEILAAYITPGNVSDCSEGVILKLTKKIFGKLFGDKGYIVNKDLFEKLLFNGVHLITKLRKNMKNKLMPLEDKLLLKKRGLIESVGHVLKECLSLEHARHRSMIGFFCHIFTTLISYSFREEKPSINVNFVQNLITC
jgi:hypothetical protein